MDVQSYTVCCFNHWTPEAIRFILNRNSIYQLYHLHFEFPVTTDVELADHFKDISFDSNGLV